MTDVTHAGGGRRRWIAMGIWTALFVVSWVLFGLPATDPLQAYLWLWAASIAWRSHLGWRAHLRFGRDWLPVMLLLEAYNYSRGLADNGVTPHATELVHADQFLLGWATGNEVPTVWLQQHFYDPLHLHWWDVGASWIYFTHFVAVPALALVLWLRNRDRWSTLMRRWFVLSFLGLATYFVYPAAPPWWASQHGLIAPVARISTRGWKAIGLHGTGNLLQTGQLGSNPIAAMPSLHSAYALLVAVTLMPMIARRWRWLLLLYPFVMTMTLLYSGEHYLVDVLFGWAYAIVSIVIADAYGRWRSRRRAASGVPDPVAESELTVA